MIQKSNYETYLNVSPIYLLFRNTKGAIKLQVNIFLDYLKIPPLRGHTFTLIMDYCATSGPQTEKFGNCKRSFWFLYASEGQGNRETLCIHKEQHKRTQKWKDIMCEKIWDEWILWSFHRVRRWRGTEEMQRVGGRRLETCRSNLKIEDGVLYVCFISHESYTSPDICF